jgi:CubicO group peptidase (beta-lactamase class C family)
MHYKESDPAILVWAAEKVEKRRFADIVRERLWSKIGAEYELEAVCDSHGFWTHYVSCTARDLARWGQMLADEGRVGDKTVLPKTFIDDIRQFNKPDLLDNDHLVGPFMPAGISYRSFFYVDSLGENAIAAMGGYGQLCYVSPATRTVIVILSSQTPFAARFADGESTDRVLQIGRAKEKERWELCREICRTLAGK